MIHDSGCRSYTVLVAADSWPSLTARCRGHRVQISLNSCTTCSLTRSITKSIKIAPDSFGSIHRGFNSSSRHSFHVVSNGGRTVLSGSNCVTFPLDRIKVTLQSSSSHSCWSGRDRALIGLNSSTPGTCASDRNC